MYRRSILIEISIGHRGFILAQLPDKTIIFARLGPLNIGFLAGGGLRTDIIHTRYHNTLQYLIFVQEHYVRPSQTELFHYMSSIQIDTKSLKMFIRHYLNNCPFWEVMCTFLKDTARLLHTLEYVYYVVEF